MANQLVQSNLNGIIRTDLKILNNDGSDLTEPDIYTLDTVKSADFEAEIQEGERIEQTVNGIMRAAINRPDILRAINMSFVNAKFSPKLFEIIAGQGTLIYDDVEVDKVIGYQAPTIAQQINNPVTPFELNMYVARYADGENVKEQVIGYYQVTITYGQGKFPGISIGEGEFVNSEFEVRGLENKSKDIGPIKVVKVDVLPA
jgi:hypothetical protein